jgi:peptidoglycan-N-acetylglucosamine deacetylase
MANFARHQGRLALSLLLCFSSQAFAQADPTDEIIREIVTAAEQAQTLEEYEQVKLDLRAVDNGFFSVRRKLDPASVCNSLAKLTSEQLIIFYDEVTRPDSNLPPACLSNLIQRIDAYIAGKVAALHSFRPKLTPCQAPTARKPQITLGPSLDVQLDNARAKTVTYGGLPECHIAFTFDDGPHSLLSNENLKALANEQVRANFFVLGENVLKFPNITRAAAQAGHVIGNHTMSHQNLPTLDEKAAEKEIADGYSVLLNLFGEYVPFFRFPFGASTPSLKGFIYGHRWLDFFWTMDTRDWKWSDPEILYRNILAEIEREKKGVILFHDTHPQTIAVVPFVLQALNEAGYTSVVFKPKEILKSVAY